MSLIHATIALMLLPGTCRLCVEQLLFLFERHKLLFPLPARAHEKGVHGTDEEYMHRRQPASAPSPYSMVSDLCGVAVLAFLKFVLRFSWFFLAFEASHTVNNPHPSQQEEAAPQPHRTPHRRRARWGQGTMGVAERQECISNAVYVRLVWRSSRGFVLERCGAHEDLF